MSNGDVNGKTNGAQKVSPMYGGLSFTEAKEHYAKKIKQEDVDHWHKHGYVIIERFLSEEELKATHADFLKYMPTWEEYKNRMPMYKTLEGGTWRKRGIGNEGTIRDEFPYDGDAVNATAVHPFLVAFAERLSGTSNLALSHGAIVGKYAGKGDYDQPLHADYSGNTMVIPVKGTEYLDIPMIVYHTDVSIDQGPTYVVPNEFTEPRNLVADGFRFHTRQEFPELYQHERPAVVPAGSVLIYSMRTFHRGSAFLAKEGLRWIQFTAFHTATAPWLGSDTFQKNAGTAEMNRFLTKASPEQRVMVGFPPVDSPYWKYPDALEGVANRYPEMDLGPYGGGPPKEPPKPRNDY